MSTWLNDTFSGESAGTNLSAHTGEAGTPWNKNTGGGFNADFLISSGGRVYNNGGGSGAAFYMASGTPGLADYDVEGDLYYLTGSGNETGILGRAVYVSGTSFDGYMLSYRPFHGFNIYRVDSGALTLIGTSTVTGDLTAGQTAHLKLSLRGSTIQATISGALSGTWSVTDATYSAAGNAAIYAPTVAGPSAGVHFDNVSATDASVPTLLAKVGTTTYANGSTYAFGTLDTGATTNLTLALTDNGGADVNIGTITKTGSRLTLAADPSGTTINPSGGATTSRNLTLSIDTTTNGAFTGSVSIPSNDSASPYVVNFTGTVATPTPPNAPSGLSASAVSSTSISVAWTDNSSNETGFTLEWSADGATGWTPFSVLAANATSYTDAVSASTTRYYRLKAQNGAGASAYSNIASASTPAAGAPLAPSHLAATAQCDTRVLLTWDNPTSGASPTSIVISRQDGGSGAYNDIATLAVGNNVWIDRSLWAATAYSYKVSEVNSIGRSTCAAVNVTTAANMGAMTTPSAFTATVVDAWTVSFAWNSLYAGSQTWVIERSENGGLTYQAIGTGDGAAGTGSTSNVFTDRYLKPGTVYKYRLRLLAYNVKSNYTAVLSVTTPARPAGGPVEATNLTSVETGPNSVLLAWTDPNGAGVTYLIERAAASAFNPIVYAQIGTIAAGSTPGAMSYTDTSVAAQGAYLYRIRPQDASSRYGGYTVPNGYPFRPVTVFTPRNASAGGRVFHIGAGQTYTSIGAFSTGFGWDNLAADDTVYIHAGTYYERLMLTCRGLPGHPIRVIGLADTSGQRPVIDGTNATTAAEFSVAYGPYETYGQFFVGPHVTNGATHAGHLVIQGFEFKNTTGAFTGYDGTSKVWAPGNGIYMTWSDHVTIRDNKFSPNSNGVFFKSYGNNPIRYCANHIVEHCWFIGCGNANSYLEHSSYTEAYDTIHQYNRYDPVRATSGGNSGIKDRGIGTTIRYCYFSGQAHYHDLVEPQDLAPAGYLDPDEGGTFVYGNVYYSTPGTGTQASDFVHYGGDQYSAWTERMGILRFYDNTILQDGNNFHIIVFSATGGLSCIDARNNIVYATNTNELDLHSTAGNGRWANNWVSSTWQVNYTYGSPYTGAASGEGGPLTISTPRGISNNGATNDPGFTSISAKDFRLVAGADALGKAQALPADWPAVNQSYADVAKSFARASVADLGAYAPAVTGDTTAPTLSSPTIATDGVTLTATLSEACRPLVGYGGFTLSGASVDSWSIAGTTLTIVLTDTVYSGATKTLSYAISGNIVDLAGNALAAITNLAVTNNSTQVPDVTAPTTPSGLTATPGVRSVGLTWTASTDNIAVVAYFVYRGGTKIATLSASSVSYTDRAVTAGISYTYAVAAVDKAGNLSAQSVSASATPAASTPASSPVPGLGTVLASVPLSWTAVALAVSYSVYRDAALIATVTTTNYTDTASQTSHSYTIVANGLDGNAVASGAAVYTPSGGGSGGTGSTPTLLAPLSAALAGGIRLALRQGDYGERIRVQITDANGPVDVSQCSAIHFHLHDRYSSAMPLDWTGIVTGTLTSGIQNEVEYQVQSTDILTPTDYDLEVECVWSDGRITTNSTFVVTVLPA